MPWTLKRMISVGIWILFIGSIIGYAIYQSRAVREGPVITIQSPENGTTFSDPVVQIIGNAHQTKELYLNGRGIFIDLEGRFVEEILLLPGYNVIELTAKDAGGHETRRTLELALIAKNPVGTTTTLATTTATHTPSVTQ